MKLKLLTNTSYILADRTIPSPGFFFLSITNTVRFDRQERIRKK